MVPLLLSRAPPFPELDRDLEVQVTGLWRQLRAERADSLFGVPDAGSLGPSRRWRPVLQALVGIIKRTVIEAERQGQVGRAGATPANFT